MQYESVPFAVVKCDHICLHNAKWFVPSVEKQLWTNKMKYLDLNYTYKYSPSYRIHVVKHFFLVILTEFTNGRISPQPDSKWRRGGFIPFSLPSVCWSMSTAYVYSLYYFELDTLLLHSLCLDGNPYMHSTFKLLVWFETRYISY